MRQLKYLLIFLGLTLANIISAQDTIWSKIDTLICSQYKEAFSFNTPYDTLQYDSEWFLFNEDLPFSNAHNVIINNLDSLLLYSKPTNESGPLLVDTVFFSLKFIPVIKFELPPIKCFDGDSIMIKDLTILYGNYTEVSYNLEGGAQLSSMDSLISVYVENGDSTRIMANYSIPECETHLDTAITLKTNFKPVSEFAFSRVCFGDTTVINNTSEFDPTLSAFSLQVDGLADYNSTQEAFKVFLPSNGDKRDVFVEITQGNCATYDTIQINNELQPGASFSALKTCENEFLNINNLSTNVRINSTYDIWVNNNEYKFENATQFSLPDTLIHDSYTALGIVNNENGCIDSFEWQIEIDSVTYVSFNNLENEYCERQDSSLLIGNIMEGQFQGMFINDIGSGKAVFRPLNPSSNIPITFSYTNELQCTDTDTQMVGTVHPKPNLNLDGLLDAYCESDPKSELILSVTNQDQLIVSNSIFEINKDGQFFDASFTLDYEFDPEIFGNYVIQNTYTDINGCFDVITNSTIVNPLPIVTLDSFIVITPGTTIEIGNLAGSEPKVEYIWTDGSDLSTLDIDRPGIYILQAMNMDTGCEASDTAKIEFDKLIETELVQIQISPNPTIDIVNLFLQSEVQNIMLVNIFGEPVYFSGTSTFSTNSNGELSLDMSNQEAGFYYILIPDIGNFLLVKI